MSYVQSMAKKILYLNQQISLALHAQVRVSGIENVSCLGVSSYQQPAAVFDVDS